MTHIYVSDDPKWTILPNIYIYMCVCTCVKMCVSTVTDILPQRQWSLYIPLQKCLKEQNKKHTSVNAQMWRADDTFTKALVYTFATLMWACRFVFPTCLSSLQTHVLLPFQPLLTNLTALIQTFSTFPGIFVTEIALIYPHWLTWCKTPSYCNWNTSVK